MIDCNTFIARYSEFRDGELSWAEGEEMQEHVDECPTCAHYHRVVQRGTDVFRALPELEVSDDFGDRLRWRLYQADDEMRREREGATRSQVAGTLAIAAVITVAAWIPLMHSQPRLGQLPAVAATAPSQATLFRRLASGSLHQEATSLTSRLAQIGVRVNEMPWHDVVFRPQGPLVGQLASYTPAPAPDPAPLQP